MRMPAPTQSEMLFERKVLFEPREPKHPEFMSI